MALLLVDYMTSIGSDAREPRSLVAHMVDRSLHGEVAGSKGEASRDKKGTKELLGYQA